MKGKTFNIKTVLLSMQRPSENREQENLELVPVFPKQLFMRFTCFMHIFPFSISGMTSRTHCALKTEMLSDSLATKILSCQLGYNF